MKKIISIILSIVILLCVFSFTLPSFALSYNGFSYETENEKIVITGYSGSNATLTIPAEIDGKSVVKIADYAFKNNNTLTSVAISEGIEDIGKGAFLNCTSLATISVPTTIIRFGEKAIYNTAYYNNKTNWKIKNSDITTGGSIDWEDISASILKYLYLDTILVEIELAGSYSIKNGTLVVADGACKGNSGATAVGFPPSLKVIGDYGFADCTSLKNLNIPDGVEFSANAIYNTGFYNNPENWENDVLYMGTRVVGTKSIEAVIKDGATHIIGGALTGTSAIIPVSVTSIHPNAFADKTDATIYGYADSYAQTYAKENNIKFVDIGNVIKGDVNFNGKLDAEDYKILCDISTLGQYQTHAIMLAGDMNEDGAVDGIDVIILDLFLNDIGPSTIKGDADGNGKVNEDDYKLLVKIVSATAEITDNYMFDRCDLNYDGAVDSFDALYLDLALNGLTTII